MLANSEADEYGYLDFEIDEDYEREGEDYEEDDEEEEEDNDDDDDEDDQQLMEELADLEEMAHLYGTQPPRISGTTARRRASASASTSGRRKSKTAQDSQQQHQQRLLQQQIQQQQMMMMSGGGVTVHPLYGTGSGFSSVNDVYTIPEEDESEQHESEGEHPSSSAGVSPRRASVNVLGGVAGTKSFSTGSVRHQLPDQAFVSSQQQPHYQYQSSPSPSSTSSLGGPGGPFSSMVNTNQYHNQNQQPHQFQQASFSPQIPANNQIQAQNNALPKIIRPQGPVQRILPSNVPVPSSSQQPNSSAVSTSSSAFSTTASNIVNSSPMMTRILNESTAKARSLRSNSEPFLQMIKPFRRGKSCQNFITIYHLHPFLLC